MLKFFRTNIQILTNLPQKKKKKSHIENRESAPSTFIRGGKMCALFSKGWRLLTKSSSTANVHETHKSQFKICKSIGLVGEQKYGWPNQNTPRGWVFFFRGNCYKKLVINLTWRDGVLTSVRWERITLWDVLWRLRTLWGWHLLTTFRNKPLITTVVLSPAGVVKALS